MPLANAGMQSANSRVVDCVEFSAGPVHACAVLCALAAVLFGGCIWQGAQAAFPHGVYLVGRLDAARRDVQFTILFVRLAESLLITFGSPYHRRIDAGSKVS